MPFAIRSQTVGVRRWNCTCGKINKTHLFAGFNTAVCWQCNRHYVLADAFFSMPHGGVGYPRVPSDLAIPAQPDEPAVATPALKGREKDAMPEAIYAAVWHSGEPVTLDMPALGTPEDQLWQDPQTGELWIARPFALMTRMLAQPVWGDSSDRLVIGRKEWRKRGMQLLYAGAVTPRIVGLRDLD